MAYSYASVHRHKIFFYFFYSKYNYANKHALKTIILVCCKKLMFLDFYMVFSPGFSFFSDFFVFLLCKLSPYMSAR